MERERSQGLFRAHPRSHPWPHAKGREEGRREIREFLETAEDVAREFWDMLKTVGRELVELGNEHGDVAASGIAGLTEAIEAAIDAMDWLLDRFEQLANWAGNHQRLLGVIQQIIGAGLPGPAGLSISAQAYGGVHEMALGGTVPIWRAAEGLTAHYLEGPALYNFPSGAVLAGESLTWPNREYVFPGEDRVTYITEEPGYDQASFGLWRELGERKGYLAGDTRGTAELERKVARLVASNERLEAMHKANANRMAAQMDELTETTAQVPPRIKDSTDWNARNSRTIRESNLSGLSREQRRWLWVRGQL
jgi:hypothetical protein